MIDKRGSEILRITDGSSVAFKKTLREVERYTLPSESSGSTMPLLCDLTQHSYII